MISKRKGRLGAGAVAATGLALIALSLAGMAGLQQRLDAAARPPATQSVEDVAVNRRDCPRDRDREPARVAPETEL